MRFKFVNTIMDFKKNNYHTIMFLVYNLNIMIYRYDSFLFNYHATIINQLFNRNRLRDATFAIYGGVNFL